MVCWKKIDGDKKGKDSWQSTHEHFGYHNGMKIFLKQNLSIKLVRVSSSCFKISLVIIPDLVQYQSLNLAFIGKKFTKTEISREISW